MKKLTLLALLFLASTSAFASEYHYRGVYDGYKADHTTIVNTTNESSNNSDDANFFVPLEGEVNITPQSLRTPWFQGLYSTTGVELSSEKPEWFTGVRAKFDAFPGDK